MSYVPADVIEVSAFGRLVGAVALDPATGVYAFEYADPWIELGQDLSPLHLPRQRGVFEFPELSRDTFYGLPAMLADSLPDRFGNALVDAWMAERGVDARLVTPLDRLAYAADRSMGALTFAPPVGPASHDVTLVQLADLVRAARAGVTGHLHDADVHDALASLISVGTSAGGARAKAVIAYNPATDQVRSGHASLPPGYEHWLVKLDGVGDPADPGAAPLGATQPYGRVEYAYALMARAAGLEMSESRLLLEGPRAHFMTRRFDRGPAGERIHLQTLCALAHLDFNLARTHSYASYLLTASALGLGPDALAQAFRRIAFNLMAVNRDDHTKNLAFLLSDGGAWRLAPAYDLTHSYWPGREWTTTHQMSVNGKFVDVTLDDLRELGDRHGVGGVEASLRDVAAATSEWREFARGAQVDDDTARHIESDVAAFAPR